MRKMPLNMVLLVLSLSLLAACDTASHDVKPSSAKPVQEKQQEAVVAKQSALLVVQEDIPVNDSLLSWRDRAGRLVSFSKGKEEEARARAKVASYPNPAEIGENSSAKNVVAAYGLMETPRIVSYKEKPKPDSWKSYLKGQGDVAYILDFDVRSWGLEPDSKNKSRYHLEMDMVMRLINVEKGSVQVNQTCYFAREFDDTGHSQYELFGNHAEKLYAMIRSRSEDCARQFNKKLQSTGKADVSG